MAKLDTYLGYHYLYGVKRGIKQSLIHYRVVDRGHREISSNQATKLHIDKEGHILSLRKT